MSIIIKGVKPPKDCDSCLFPDCNLWMFMDVGERHPKCPIIEVTGPLIDRNELEKAVLKWMPHDPCGKEELERPFETDICVSMMMEIGEQEVIADADCVRTDSTSE